MKKYLSFFRIRFINGLQYRTAAAAGIVTQFAWGFMEILMYSAFYRSNMQAIPMETTQLTSYLWLRQALLALFMSWYFDNDIIAMIINGDVAYEMCRPTDVYTMFFIKNSATRISRAVLRCFPIFLIASLLPYSMRLHPPNDAAAFALFLVSAAAGFLLTVSFSMIVYVIIFRTLSPTAPRIIAQNIVSFLSGEIIPLPFLPEKLRIILDMLPFASMQNTPFLIYIGVYSAGTAVTRILLQLFWLAVLFAVGNITMKTAMRRLVIQGG